MKIKFKHLISPFKWWMFLRGLYYSWSWGVGDCRSLYCLDLKLSDMPDYYKEQVLERAEACIECLQKGKCIECGCTSPANFLNSPDKCSLGNWGPMDDEIIWNLKHLTK